MKKIEEDLQKTEKNEILYRLKRDKPMGIAPAANHQLDLPNPQPQNMLPSLGARIVHWFQDETTSEIQKIACIALLAIATFTTAQATGKPILFFGALGLLTTSWVKFEEYKMELAKQDDLDDLIDPPLRAPSFDEESAGDVQRSEEQTSDEIVVFDAKAPHESLELDEKEPDDRNEPFLERLMKAVGGAEKYCQLWEVPATEEDLKKYMAGSDDLPLPSNPQRGVIMRRNQHYFLIRFSDKQNNKKAFLLTENEEYGWECYEYDGKEKTTQKIDITHYILHTIELALRGGHPFYRLG